MISSLNLQGSNSIFVGHLSF